MIVCAGCRMQLCIVGGVLMGRGEGREAAACGDMMVFGDVMAVRLHILQADMQNRQPDVTECVTLVRR